MLITTGGVLIRTRVNEIREMGRSTQGVTLINLAEGEKLSGLQRIMDRDDDNGENGGNGTNGDARRERRGDGRTATAVRNAARRRRRRRRRPRGIASSPAARIFNFGAGPAAHAGRGAREGEVGARQLARQPACR